MEGVLPDFCFVNIWHFFMSKWGKHFHSFLKEWFSWKLYYFRTVIMVTQPSPIEGAWSTLLHSCLSKTKTDYKIKCSKHPLLEEVACSRILCSVWLEVFFTELHSMYVPTVINNSQIVLQTVWSIDLNRQN